MVGDALLAGSQRAGLRLGAHWVALAAGLSLIAAACSLDTRPLRSRADSQYRNDADVAAPDAFVSVADAQAEPEPDAPGPDAAPPGAAAEAGCDEDAGCQPVECEPGRSQCQGEGALRTCAASGQWSAAVGCSTLCRDDRCYDCLPGAAECAGATSRVCSADGHWNDTTCADGCTNGRCHTCQPDARRCANNSQQICSAQGAWATDRACGDLGCGSDRCAACGKGAAECDGAGRHVCGDDGQWSATQPCPAGCSAGMCDDPCSPGALRCSASGAQTCGVDQRWTVPRPCPMGCNGISCAQCREGAIECLTPTALRICRDNAWGAIETCRPNATCDSTPDNGNVCPCDRGYSDPHPNPGLCTERDD